MFQRMRSRLEGSRPRQVLFSKLARGDGDGAVDLGCVAIGDGAEEFAGGGIADFDHGGGHRPRVIRESSGLTQRGLVRVLVHAADGDADQGQSQADHDDDGGPGDQVEPARSWSIRP